MKSFIKATSLILLLFIGIAVYAVLWSLFPIPVVITTVVLLIIGATIYYCIIGG